MTEQLPADAMATATARQREAWETATRLGSQSAAARALETTQGHLRAHLVGYARSMGISLNHLPGQTSTGRPREHALYPLIDRILRGQEAIDRRLDAQDQALASLERKLDQLILRPLAAPTLVSTRRIADGGRGERRERKAS